MGSEIGKKISPVRAFVRRCCKRALTMKGCRRAVLLGDVADPEKIYKDDKPGLSAAMKDNLEFINTHPNLVGFLMGLLISMEEKGENRDTIKGLKVALFGPIAGIGDAIFWFTLLPIMAGICSSFASGKPAGADSIFRRLPAYLFPARRLDPRRLFSRREGDR